MPLHFPGRNTLLTRLQEHTLFCKFDLKCANYQILKVAESSVTLLHTIFRQELCNCVSTCDKAFNNQKQFKQHQIYICFLDDIICCIQTSAKHDGNRTNFKETVLNEEECKQYQGSIKVCSYYINLYIYLYINI